MTFQSFAFFFAAQLGYGFTLTYLIFICAILAITYYWLRYIYTYWRRHNVPHLRATLLIGNIGDLLQLKMNIGEKFYQIYYAKSMRDAPMVGIQILNKPAVVLRDLELIKRVLIKDFAQFSNRSGLPDPHDQLGSKNLFFVRDTAWREMRAKLTHIFSAGKIKQMYPLIEEIGKELQRHLAQLPFEPHSQTDILELRHVMSLYTTDVIASIAFGLRANSLQNPGGEFARNNFKMFHFTLRRAFDVFIVMLYPRLSSLFGIRVFPPSLERFLTASVRYAMEQRESSGHVRNDLIDTFVAMRRENQPLARDPSFLVAQAALFLTAGYETSSGTLTFTLYELAKHPEWQQRVRAEILTALAAGGGRIDYEQMQQLECLGMVVSEVLRLHPGLSFLDRQCEALDGYVADDLIIPHGTSVFVSVMALHRDPKYWPNPHKFDPLRFSLENRGKHLPCTYMPFGNGPHNCIGMRLGLLQVKVGLVHFLQHYTVETCDRTLMEMEYDPKAILLQAKGGLYLKICRSA